MGSFKKSKLVKAIAVGTALVMALGIMAGCGKEKKVPGVTDTTIKIGAFGALSGPVAAVGVPVKKGMEAYINYINEQGGVNGRKIELLFEDDAFNPANSLAAVKKLVEQDKVFCISPALGTPGVMATMDYLMEKEVPLIYPMTGAAEPAVPVKKYIFAVQPNYLEEAGVIVRYVETNMGGKKVAVLWQNTDIGKQGLKGVKDELAKHPGLQLVYDGSHEAKDTDFSTYIVKAKEAGADTLIMYTVVAQAAGIMKEARKQGLDAKFVTTYVNSDMNLFKLGGDAVEGLVMPGWAVMASPDDPNFKKFVEIYKKYNPNDGTPSGYATAGFIAGEVLVKGLQEAGKDLTRESFLKAMETKIQNFNGIQAHNITYSADSHSGVATVYFLKCDGGKFTPIDNAKMYPLKAK